MEKNLQEKKSKQKSNFNYWIYFSPRYLKPRKVELLNLYHYNGSENILIY